jgi:hypothetical protein
LPYSFCIPKHVSAWHKWLILGGAAGIFLHSSFSLLSRFATFLHVDSVGDSCVSPNYLMRHPFHVLVCKVVAPLAMKYACLYDSCNMNSMMIGDSASLFFSSLVKLGIIRRPGMFLWMQPIGQ